MSWKEPKAVVPIPMFLLSRECESKNSMDSDQIWKSRVCVPRTAHIRTRISMRKENCIMELFHASLTEKTRFRKNKLSSWEGEGLSDLMEICGRLLPLWKGRRGLKAIINTLLLCKGWILYVTNELSSQNTIFLSQNWAMLSQAFQERNLPVQRCSKELI